MKKGGGLGMVVLVIVVAIVLLLAAKQWQAVAPTAMQLDDKGTHEVTVHLVVESNGRRTSRERGSCGSSSRRVQLGQLLLNAPVNAHWLSRLSVA